MKLSQFRHIIKEEVRRVLKESTKEESIKKLSAVNEFGPLAGSKNVDQFEAIKRDASRKSEKGDTIYVVGTKGGGFKISKYYEQDNTYAAYNNGFPIPVD